MATWKQVVQLQASFFRTQSDDQTSNNAAKKAEQPQQQIPVTQEVIFNYSNTNYLANISTSALHKSCWSFQAGQVRHFIQNWAILTSDPFILNAVKHYDIEFEGDFPVQTQRPYQIRFSAEETRIIDSEILKYLSKRVIEPACVTPESFVSTIFILVWVTLYESHTCMGHIDDSLLLGYHHEARKNNIVHSTNLLQQFGFVIHPEKSVLHPVQAIEFLGFVINSLSMTVRLIPRKIR